MLASKSSRRNDIRRRSSKSRSMKSIYDSQRPSGVSRDDWATVFDAFLVEWAQSLAREQLEAMAGKRVATAA